MTGAGTFEVVFDATHQYVTVTGDIVRSHSLDFIIGDLAGDGKVTIDDATLLQRFLAEYITLDLDDEKTFLQADVNGDKKVNIRDITEIQRMIAEIQ